MRLSTSQYIKQGSSYLQVLNSNRGRLGFGTGGTPLNVPTVHGIEASLLAPVTSLVPASLRFMVILLIMIAEILFEKVKD
jgi:hypothetical protein